MAYSKKMGKQNPGTPSLKPTAHGRGSGCHPAEPYPQNFAYQQLSPWAADAALGSSGRKIHPALILDGFWRDRVRTHQIIANTQGLWFTSPGPRRLCAHLGQPCLVLLCTGLMCHGCMGPLYKAKLLSSAGSSPGSLPGAQGTAQLCNLRVLGAALLPGASAWQLP